MAIDILQDKIRKMKNPLVLDLSLPADHLPGHLIEKEGRAAAYGRFCRELLYALKGIVPAVRVGYTAFSLLGQEGMTEMIRVLEEASSMGYYTILEGPYILSPMMAQATADAVFGPDATYPCDGLILTAYPGSDVVKPFLPYCRDGKKDLFVVIRTSNKSAPEIQDLLTGSRLVHAAAADIINRFGVDNVGRSGYARVAVLAGANSSQSLKNLRSKYPRLFLLLDDMDYSCCNAKLCADAFDKFGHGAAVCAGPIITCAWRQEGSDGSDYAAHAAAAAERLKKNLTRYTTIL